MVISNPTSLHLDVAIPAAEAGCHLLLEKPISRTMDRVSTLADIVDRQNVRVLVGFQFRFHPGLQRIKGLIVSDTIGSVYLFTYIGENTFLRGILGKIIA